MPGLINIGGALSAAGGAIAQTAGDAALVEQKQMLEQQSMKLANDLQTGRELTVGAQSQAAEMQRTVYSETAQTGRTNTTEAGATARNTADIAGRQQNVETQEAGANTRNAQEIAGRHADVQAEIKGRASDVAAQIAANADEISVDPNTGNAILLNKLNGSSKPLADAYGKPVQIPNAAAAQVTTASINALNEQLRAVNLQRSNDVKAAQAEVTKFLGSAGVPIDKPGYAAAKQHLEETQQQYDEITQPMLKRLQALTETLLMKAGVPASTAAPNGTRPPLSSFDQSQ